MSNDDDFDELLCRIQTERSPSILDMTCVHCGQRRGSHKMLTEQCVTVFKKGDRIGEWYRKTTFRASGRAGDAAAELCARCAEPQSAHRLKICTAPDWAGETFIPSGKFGEPNVR